MPSCFKAIYWQLQLSNCNHFCILAVQTNFIKLINRASNTLFIIRTDSHKIIYPFYLYQCKTVTNFLFFTLDFLLRHPHLHLFTDELFSAGVMSLRAHITKAKTSPLLTKKIIIIPPPPRTHPVLMRKIKYRKIPKTSPGAYIFQRPFLRGLFLEGLIF